MLVTAQLRSDVQIGVNLAPFMIHELLLSPTETASGSHPCRVVSVTYHRPSCFHGGNTGSNPVGDANYTHTLQNVRKKLHQRVSVRLAGQK